MPPIDDEFSLDGLPPPDSGPPIPDEVAAAGADLLGQMSDVSEHAIAQHENATAEAAANVEKDDFGTPFDPAIHTGTKLKSGKWREKKNPGGRPGSIIGKSSRQKTAETTATASTGIDETAARAAGIAVAHTIVNVCSVAISKEWNFKKEPDEQAMLEKAWGDYFVAKNITEFPPGVALVMAMGAYAAPRFTMPETQQKAGKVKTWLALRVTKWKVKKELRKRGIDAKVTIANGEILVNGDPLPPSK